MVTSVVGVVVQNQGVHHSNHIQHTSKIYWQIATLGSVLDSQLI